MARLIPWEFFSIFKGATKHTFSSTAGTAATHSKRSGSTASLSSAKWDIPSCGNDKWNFFKNSDSERSSSYVAKLIIN